MKRLCIFFLIPQIALAEPAGSVQKTKQYSDIVARPRDNIEFARSSLSKNVKKPSRPKVVSFEIEPKEEAYVQKNYKEQGRVKKVQRTVDDEQDAKREEAKEKAEQQAAERAKRKAADKSKDRALTTEMSDDQQIKIQNIKKGLSQLQEDATVRNVFKSLDMYTEFQSLMSHITNTSDEQVTQEDLDSVQDFLTKLVGQKDTIQLMDQRTKEKFLSKFTQVLQQNFSELSPEELTQFLTQVSTMTTKALEPQPKKPVSKKSTSIDSSGKPEKQQEHKSSAKGGMPSSSVDMLGFMVGLSLVAGIFVLIGTLANQN